MGMGQARFHIHTKRDASHRFPAKLIGGRLSRGPVLAEVGVPYDQPGRCLMILWSRFMQRPHGCISRAR
jgi:hypothetical protein